jgi:hypothetical protein
MRRANQNTAVFCEHGNVLLSFGYDYCSEHEWGIAGIRSAFGVSDDKDDLTIARFAVTRTPEQGLFLFEAKPKGKAKRLYLLGGNVGLHDRTPEKYALEHRESWADDEKPEALWNERAFMFSVPAAGKDAERVRKVHAAIVAHDALIYLASSGNPFGGTGLVIVRRSTIPKNLTDQMEEGFRDQKRLREASDATGIVARVEAWGSKRGTWGQPFYALSPKWMFKDRKASSTHPVIYWLNPTDQQNNNAGWFTVEELEQWMEGKGPIPGKQRRSA